MTLRIGNKGLTLIEVMLTVSILSLGTVMIYQANLLSLGVYGRYVHRLSLQNWAEEKIWEAKEDIFNSDLPNTGEVSGSFNLLGKSYDWKREVSLTWESKDSKFSFYKILLTVSWDEEGKPTSLYRSGGLHKIKL